MVRRGNVSQMRQVEALAAATAFSLFDRCAGRSTVPYVAHVPAP